MNSNRNSIGNCFPDLIRRVGEHTRISTLKLFLLARARMRLHVKEGTTMAFCNKKDYFNNAVLNLILLRETQWCNILDQQTSHEFFHQFELYNPRKKSGVTY